MGIDLSPNEYLDCSTTPGNTLGNTTIATISLWFKANTTISNDGIFYIGSLASAVGAIEVYLGSNVLTLRTNTGLSQSAAFTDTASWHHLVARLDGTNAVLFIDNVKVINVSFSTAFNCTGLKTIIGAYYAATFTFDGQLFDTRLYSNALTDAQVATIYHSRGNDNITDTMILRVLMQGTGGATVTAESDLSPAQNTIAISGSPIYLPTTQKLGK